jgi:hypothetical protein
MHIPSQDPYGQQNTLSLHHNICLIVFFPLFIPSITLLLKYKTFEEGVQMTLKIKLIIKSP